MTRFLILVLSLLAFPFPFLEEPFTSWSLDEAVTVLNDSPWARQTTFTEVVEGVGSGVRGEGDLQYFLYAHPVLTSCPAGLRASRTARPRGTQLDNNRTGGVRRGRFLYITMDTGDTFADFLLGIPDTAERGVGSDRNDLRRSDRSFFIEEGWKISPVVSLSAGIAYSYYEPYR